MTTTSSSSSDQSRPDTLRRHLRALYRSDDPRPVALAYLLLLTLAEILTVFTVVQLGLLLHLSLLFLLLLHAAATWQRPLHRLLLGLAFVPLIRVISLTLPLVGFPLVYWYLITSVPLFLSALVVMRLLGFSWRDVILRPTGLKWHGWLLQIAIGLSGIGLGYVEYLILRPEPLVDAPTLSQIWLPALILLISTGYMEELLFRRVMQRPAVEQLGPAWGILYVAVFFAVLHIGYKSLVDLLFVFAVGLAFGIVVHRTASLLGVTLAHGLTNIALFLLMPFWIGGGESPFLPLAQTLAPAPEPVTVAAAPDSVAPGDSLAPGESSAPTASPAAMVLDQVTAPPSPAVTTPEPTAATVAGATATRPPPLVTVLSPTPTDTPAPAPTGTSLPVGTLSPATATVAVTVSAGGQHLIEHEVQAGQYLRLIARLYQTTTEILRELNGLETWSIIHPGDILLVPVPPEATAPAIAPAIAPATATEEAGE